MSKHDNCLDLSVSFESPRSEALISLQAVTTVSVKLCLNHFSVYLPFRWYWARYFHLLNKFMPSKCYRTGNLAWRWAKPGIRTQNWALISYFVWAPHSLKLAEIPGFPLVCSYVMIIVLVSEGESWKTGPKPDTENGGRTGTSLKDCISTFLPPT